ncbi:MAG: alpha/beta hydrolase [Bacteroidales bacterium]|nr:alpha/beta hydrolase [Bacteroidales bacterium]MBN2757901.1 alpha/beta hydrolase [Bacteroidales bacterium]
MALDFDFKNTIVREKQAEYLQFKNGGVNAHFYGANGFPLGVYTEFIKNLSNKFDLTCLSLRACWPNIGNAPKQTNWEIYADDLIAFLEQNFTEPIIAIGHSQGATASIIAASKRPDLFKSLIIIEPASVSRKWEYILKLVPYFIKKTQQPIKSALEKQDIWNSRDEFYKFIRKNKAYKRVSDKVLEDFAKFGLEKTENGKFKLSFSLEWEAANYSIAPSIWKYLKKINLPIQVIAGKPSIFFSNELREKWKQIAPNSLMSVNEQFGHLFPLEAPEICADLIKI